ncbi:MAG TPA: nitroreductase family protein [Nitrososphaerales archaeon]|nr:nitroreductase family protein [Nitrososphaerales archaeon]
MAERETVSSSQATAIFDIMRKRHACRQFDPRPIPSEILDKLVYAAHRAPTGGNAPYRFVVVVSDQTLLRMVRLVSPGFFGDCSVAIFICTDMDVAKKSGSDALNEIAHIDAGAAAENVILAAYSLGLAGSFIRSYSESAISKLLRLPESCRTELLISIGYPAKYEQKPLKRRKGATRTYANRFGRPWAVPQSGG